MEGIDDILKAAKLHQSSLISLGLTSQLSEMIKAKDNITKSLSGVSMIAELTKSMQQQYKMYENPTLSAAEAITNSMMLHAKLTIPETTFAAIHSINQQHEQLFVNLKSITKTINKNLVAFNQINSLQFAISGISGQLAAIAATQKNWNLIDDFDEIAEEAVSLNERFLDENGLSKEGLKELKQFFQRIEVKVDKIDADANALFWKFLTLLGFILAIMSEARNWLPKPDYATKQEVETVIKEQFTIYEKKLKQDKEFRITNKACMVMSKPRLKSIVIEKLPNNFEVTVLQVNHKWVLVSYFDPKDNLPQTGWIMKKCLDRPE